VEVFLLLFQPCSALLLARASLSRVCWGRLGRLFERQKGEPKPSEHRDSRFGRGFFLFSLPFSKRSEFEICPPKENMTLHKKMRLKLRSNLRYPRVIESYHCPLRRRSSMLPPAAGLHDPAAASMQLSCSASYPCILHPMIVGVLFGMVFTASIHRPAGHNITLISPQLYYTILYLSDLPHHA
jgi:hypothetical protein